jgi:hypothetical protein
MKTINKPIPIQGNVSGTNAKPTTFVLDESAINDLNYLQEIAGLMLNMRVSKAVIVRTALMSYADCLKNKLAKNPARMNDVERDEFKDTIKAEQGRILRGAGKTNRIMGRS